MPDQVTIERLGHRGDGIAEGPVYVPRTLPGERVEGERVGGTGAGDRLTNVRILEPSGHRVSAPCAHYRSCGGCSLMHAADDFVASWKMQVVQRALDSQGVAAEIDGIHTSRAQSRRRAKFTLKRTKAGAVVGFNATASHTVVDTPGCLLVHPNVLAARPVLAEIAGVVGSRKGTISALVTCVEGGVDISLSGGPELSAPLRMRLAALATEAGVLRMSWNGDLLIQTAPPVLKVSGIAVGLPSGAFLQATEGGEQALRDAVTEAVGAAERVADLFCGVGTFALPLARKAEVTAVEGDADMVAALEAAWRRSHGLKRIAAATRDLFRRPLEADELAPYDAVVIDPPRAGAEAQMARLAASDVPRIAAVSCNPVTFARDARILQAGGYRVEWVRIVDQFRWSAHVELVACFARQHTKKGQS